MPRAGRTTGLTSPDRPVRPVRACSECGAAWHSLCCGFNCPRKRLPASPFSPGLGGCTRHLEHTAHSLTDARSGVSQIAPETRGWQTTPSMPVSTVNRTDRTCQDAALAAPEWGSSRQLLWVPCELRFASRSQPLRAGFMALAGPPGTDRAGCSDIEGQTPPFGPAGRASRQTFRSRSSRGPRLCR